NRLYLWLHHGERCDRGSRRDVVHSAALQAESRADKAPACGPSRWRVGPCDGGLLMVRGARRAFLWSLLLSLAAAAHGAMGCDLILGIKTVHVDDTDGGGGATGSGSSGGAGPCTGAALSCAACSECGDIVDVVF